MSFRNYYDSSSTYGRNREAARSSNVSTDRPATVTAKYTTTPSYKSSSIPVLNDRCTREETPISTIANRYASYSKSTTTEKPSSKYEKKDYSKLSVPSLNTNRSRDVSPAPISKYSINRTSRHTSPERKTVKSFKEKSQDISPADRDKDIPNKTDKTTSYSSLSNYKLYPRTPSYSKPSPTTRVDSKPEVTVNRYAIANRLASSSYLRSPTPVKRPSVSPISHLDVLKPENEKNKIPNCIIEEKVEKEDEFKKGCTHNGTEVIVDENDQIESVSVITRHTSPTPPGSSVYVRMRRADMAKTIEKIITRARKRPEMVDKEIQSDRLDDSTRTSRFGSSSRTSMTNWTYFSPNSNNYTGYAGRYSTQYSNLRENSNNERSSRSRSKEPMPTENKNSSSCTGEKVPEKSIATVNHIDHNEEVKTTHKENKENDTSEIIVNVNFKLKKSKSNQSSVTPTELLPSEITVINNHQLPPQPPKSESVSKVKKVKSRKSSTDSTSDSTSSKKVVKKRSKSVSSTDSDQSSEKSTKSKESSKLSSKGLKRTPSVTNLPNGSRLKYSKSRESYSPESSITLSTQSSISEDEMILKSKANDISKPSTCESTLQNDHPNKTSHKGEGTEEAKSFLIRALAPVTNLFKSRHQDINETKPLLENDSFESSNKDIPNLIIDNVSIRNKNNTSDIIASNEDSLVKLKAIRPIESGDRTWQESGNKNGNQSVHSNTPETRENDMIRPLKLNCFADDEKPWWLDSCANIPEGIERLSPPRKSSSDSDKSEKVNLLKVKHNESGERKDWRFASNENVLNVTKQDSQSNLSLSKSGSDQRNFQLRRIRHIESGERPWWLSSDKNIPEGIEILPTPPPQPDSDSSDSEEVEVYVPPTQIPPFPLHLPDDEPLGDRRSPEGLETPNEDYRRGRNSPYENNRQYVESRRSVNLPYQKGEKYISRYTDIDDILGTSGQIYSPFMDSILARRTGQVPFDDDECEEIDPTQVRIHDSTPQMPIIKKLRCRSEIIDFRNEEQLDDVTLQVFKDGDYGPYLDMDSTLGEQDEELEGLDSSQDGARFYDCLASTDSDMMRQASVDSGLADSCHDISDITSTLESDDGSEYDFKDACDHFDDRKNALVLRTQLSVRVHAIIERLLHSQGRELRRALFTLKQILQQDKDLVHEFVANKGLDCLMQVANTADHNYLDYILRALGQILLYVDGMHGVMNHKRCVQWLYSLIASKLRHVVKTALKLLLVFVEYTDKNCLILIDAIIAMDSSNDRQPWYNIMKILQDFDASDTELLIYATTLINRCLNNVPDRDMYYDQVDALLDQGIDSIIQLYMSKQGTDLDLLRQLQIFEAVLLYEDGDETGTALKQLDDTIITSVRRRSLNMKSSERRKSKKQQEVKDKAKTPIISKPEKINSPKPSLVIDVKENKELSAALKRRKDRYARQAHHIVQQELLNSSNGFCNGTGTGTGTGTYLDTNGTYNSTKYNINTSTNGTIVYNSSDNGQEQEKYTRTNNLPDVLMNGNQRYTAGLKLRIQNGTLGHSVNATDTMSVARQISYSPEPKDDREILLNREHSIKDLAQRLSNAVSPTTEEKPLRVSDMAGIVSKAKEELAKSKSKELIKSPTIEKSPKILELIVSENDLHWEELKKGCINREFHLCDLDFSDLKYDSDDETESPTPSAIPPPPPNLPPPPPNMFPPVGLPPPPPKNFFSLPKTLPAISSADVASEGASTLRKNKKTVKLFWREIHENPVPPPIRPKIGGFIWDDLPQISLDTAVLEHLFESRTNDLIIKKLMEPKRNLILDTKRSNAISIAMKKLPTPQTIKVAIMKMDATVIGREGIEKLLTMLPTEEEKVKIHEAQFANPDLPLGSAEQFLLTLASINELPSRLKLWVFKLDFDNLEKEIAEPLMDLKQGIELLKVNRTFKVILSTLRSVGSFLNGTQVKGFRLEYLSKVMEVKDTVHKHPLLYHVCEMIIENFPDTSDFFSEVGPVIRASKVDFEVLNLNLIKLESDCKASWDHMKRVAKHDSTQIFKTKINEFLTDAAERIILLSVVKKRVINRYNKFLLYLGVPVSDIQKTRPSELLKVIAEFALEYRTTRERVLQQLEKRANHRERNKTRGKMIIDVGNYATKGEHAADSALKELLKSDADTALLNESRRKPARLLHCEGSTEDEIIESLVRSATSKRRPLVRDRRRNRLSDRTSLNRTLDGHQSWPGNQVREGSAAEIQQR